MTMGRGKKEASHCLLCAFLSFSPTSVRHKGTSVEEKVRGNLRFSLIDVALRCVFVFYLDTRGEVVRIAFPLKRNLSHTG